MERRLSAILVADMVGYSGLMELDEIGTIARQKVHRAEVIDPAFALHSGRIIKTTGDGLLAEFPSVVEAVKCAVTIQRTMADLEASIPEETRIAYRVGINLGDVIHEDGDLHGDGVNVAARLEQMADPGGVCISGTAYDQLRANVEVGYEDLGEVQVKNIARPIRAYRVLLDPAQVGIVVAVPSKRGMGFVRPIAAVAVCLAMITGAVWWWGQQSGIWSSQDRGNAQASSVPTSQKPSIAVLPFTNLSGDAEQDYFSDGMTVDLITDLSKISALIVISRTSTLVYKDQSPDIRTVAKELNVDFLVEGTVRKSGGKVRITAQLISGSTGEHLWADRYDRDYSDIFALQDEVREKIVSALSVTLSPDEKRRLARPLTNNPEAYDYFLQGLKQESFFTKQGNLQSTRLFERAIEIDPEFAAAYSHLAQAYSLAVENNWTATPEHLIAKALETALQGTEWDNELPYAYWSLGRIYTRPYLGDPERAKIAFKRAIHLNPNYADGMMFLAFAQIYTGEAEKSLELIENAMRINPHYPFWYLQAVGMVQFFMGDYEASVETLEKSIGRNPNVPWLYRYLIASYGQLGMTEEAEWSAIELEALDQPITIADFMNATPLHDSGYRKMYEDALRKAGLPE